MDDKTSEIILGAITSRKSVRSFLPDAAVDQRIVRRILQAASSAPSGSNTQPWHVHVLTGESREQLSAALLEAHQTDVPEQREYEYYPKEWRSPYLERRRAMGVSLYKHLGVERGDPEAAKAQRGKNYEFFGAPVVMIFTIDKVMEVGSWLDYGMFLQSIMIAARACGLHTCPQASLANYPEIVKQHLQIPKNQTVICGIALGYEDTQASTNQYRTGRLDLEEFVQFHHTVAAHTTT